VATDESTEAHIQTAERSRLERRHRVRLLGVIGALATAFALLNLGNVKVNWLVSTGHTPLIIVIVVTFLFGMLADRLLLLRSRRKRQ
jgi:uncharacterized integral membrane protein